MPAVFGLVGAGLLAYLVGETSLASRPHPLHWAVALLGGGLGYAGGLAFYKLRGY
jgi:hypothetical protein